MMNPSTSIVTRVIGVIRLDPPTIRAITRDPGSTRQAAVVVGAVALAAALGSVDGTAGRLLLVILAVLAIWGVRGGHTQHVAQAFHSGHARVGGEHLLNRTIRHIRTSGPVAGILIVALIAAAVVGIGIQLSGLIGGFLLPLLAWLIFSGVAFFASSHLFGEPTTRSEFAPILRLVGFALAPGVLAIFSVIPFVGGLALAVAIGWALVAATFAIRQTVMIGTLRATLTTMSAAVVTVMTCGVLALLFG